MKRLGTLTKYLPILAGLFAIYQRYDGRVGEVIEDAKRIPQTVQTNLMAYIVAAAFLLVIPGIILKMLPRGMMRHAVLGLIYFFGVNMLVGAMKGEAARVPFVEREVLKGSTPYLWVRRR